MVNYYLFLPEEVYLFMILHDEILCSVHIEEIFIPPNFFRILGGNFKFFKISS